MMEVAQPVENFVVFVQFLLLCLADYFLKETAAYGIT